MKCSRARATHQLQKRNIKGLTRQLLLYLTRAFVIFRPITVSIVFDLPGSKVLKYGIFLSLIYIISIKICVTHKTIYSKVFSKKTCFKYVLGFLFCKKRSVFSIHYFACLSAF